MYTLQEYSIANARNETAPHVRLSVTSTVTTKNTHLWNATPSTFI